MDTHYLQEEKDNTSPVSKHITNGSLNSFKNEEDFDQYQERMLRDSFIKTFMLIFTNENSNH